MENRERECKHRIKIGASILTMQKRSSILASMNKLDKTERAKILHLLCEGMSIRAITRLTGGEQDDRQQTCCGRRAGRGLVSGPRFPKPDLQAPPDR